MMFGLTGGSQAVANSKGKRRKLMKLTKIALLNKRQGINWVDHRKLYHVTEMSKARGQ